MNNGFVETPISSRSKCDQPKVRSDQSKNDRSPKEYPIGKWELAVYFAVWILHSAIAFVLATIASRKVGHWLDHWLEPSSYLSNTAMDNSDVELKLFRRSLPSLLATFTFHSIVFRLSLQFLPNKIRSVLLISVWIAIHTYLASFLCLFLIFVFAFSILAITSYSRTQLFAWAISILLIVSVSKWAPFSRDPSQYYREFNLYLYSAIKIINLSIYLVRKNISIAKICPDLVLQFVEYLLYPPFSCSLIVLFEDFQRQSDQLINSKIDKQKIKLFIWRLVRLLFWIFVLDLILHICRANAFFNSPFTLLKHFNHYEVSSIAYVAGQLFHVKYVLIFGFPALFASLDGFQPPGPPLCISRISKYSQMWRYFDRGLYAFLRDQVYIPLMNASNCGGKFTVLVQRFVSMLSVFLFVLLWHGLSSNYLWWVCLSAFELCIERVGRDIIWPSRLFQQNIHQTFSDANFTRLKAVSMLFTVIPGIFGVFFFLGRTGSVGSHIFGSVLVNGLLDIFTFNIRFLNAGFVLLHLFLIGYCFNHVCLYIETKLGTGETVLNGIRQGKRD